MDAAYYALQRKATADAAFRDTRKVIPKNNVPFEYEASPSEAKPVRNTLHPNAGYVSRDTASVRNMEQGYSVPIDHDC